MGDYVIVDPLWLASLSDSLRQVARLPKEEAAARLLRVAQDIDLLMAQAEATRSEIAMMGAPLTPLRRKRVA